MMTLLWLQGTGAPLRSTSLQLGAAGGSSQVGLTGSSAFQTVALFVEGAEDYYLVELPSSRTTATALLLRH